MKHLKHPTQKQIGKSYELDYFFNLVETTNPRLSGLEHNKQWTVINQYLISMSKPNVNLIKYCNQILK